MRTSLKRRFGKAFTLIELLIVITIIGILAVALIPRVTQGPAKARDVKRKSDVQNIGTALELYYGDSGSYPTTTGCADTAIGSTLNNYTQGIPLDPNSTNTNIGSSCAGKYYYANLNGSFGLAAHLEQVSTGDNIYCNIATTDFVATPTTLSTFQLTINALALKTCINPTSDKYYYVIVR